MLSLSPDGNTIAYIGIADNSPNIFVRELNGSNKSLQRTFRGDVNAVCFCPAGDKISYSDYSAGNTNVYMAPSRKGMQIRQITTSSETEYDPCFSSDGKTIFFVKSFVKISNLFTIASTNYAKLADASYIWSYNLEENTLSQLTSGYSPSLINDNLMLVTRLNGETKMSEIWLVNIEEEEEYVILSRKDKSFSSACLSPDGKYFVCVGTSNTKIQLPGMDRWVKNLDIFLSDIEGKQLTQLTFHPSNDSSPAWNVDGKSIYFLSQRGNIEGDWNIWNLGIDNLR
jgi:Tol biopolymer transport system component